MPGRGGWTAAGWTCRVPLNCGRLSFPQSLTSAAFPFSFQIASSLSKELCALVFGVNTFLATVLKTIITLIVSDKRGLGLPVHSQFFIYFVYFLVLFGVYLLGALVVVLRHFRDGRRAPQPPALSPAEEKAMQPLATLEQSLQPEAKA